MTMKKAMFFSVCLMMLFVFAFAGCGKSSGDTEAPDSTTVEETAAPSVADMEEPDILEGCALTDEEMLQVVEQYYGILETVVAEQGEPVDLTVKSGKDSIGVYVNKEDEPRLEWETVRDAFSFLYAQGQVDLEGNILVNSDTVATSE